MVSRSCFSRGYQLGLSGLLILVGLIGGEGGDITQAQVTADPSLGTEVTPNGTTLEVTGGTTVGGKNLFHSFSNFSVQSEEVVNFRNASTINNILVRVTGGNPSDIQGTLQVEGKANFFLINPNGIVFGPNAQLNIGGSFIGTTANVIQFPGGGEFSMISQVNPLNPLLTVNPSALLFNQIAEQPISSIQVNKAFLEVPEGQSLLLVGGDVKLERGRLQAISGQVELGGLAGVGTVGLNMDSNNFRLSFPVGVQRADVFLTDEARVIADGSGGGIQVQGRQIRLTENSEISIVNDSNSGLGGTLAVTASELLELKGGSRLLTVTESTGDAGDIRIETGRLIVQDGSQVSASTNSQGRGGTLSVTAKESIQLIGTSVGDISTGLFTATGGIGDAGSLEIKTGQLIIQDGAIISASTIPGSSGQGGNIIVETGELDVRNGAQVTVSSFGSGNAGELRVNANSIKLDRGKLTATTASGRGGDINLQVQDLILMRNGSAIATTAANNGSGGNIRINAPFIVADKRENSDILANANLGSGGRIEINATGIYGLENRTQQTPSENISEINASSDFGLDGTIEINTPEINLNTDLINLPAVPVDTEVATGCNSPNSAQSSFVITGRGGLPLNPREAFNSDTVRVDWVTLNRGSDNRRSQTVTIKPTTATPEPIVEATGWAVNEKGEVILTANPSTTTPHGSWQKLADCSTIQSNK